MSLHRSPSLRRLVWRTGRKLYTWARGEKENAIERNGEAYVQRCVAAHLRGGEHILDVGANQGEWTQSLLTQLPAQARTTTQIWAFEPIPSTFDRLSKSIAGPGVRLVNAALSDRDGEAEMVMLSQTGGTNTLNFDPALRRDAHGVTRVPLMTLETFCASNAVDRIALMKCDTEGNDFNVLRGGKALFDAGRIAVVQFEYNSRWIYARCYLKDVFDLLAGLPYKVARVCPEHIEVFDRWHFELDRFFEDNYLIVRDDALGWFDCVRGAFDEANTYA